MLLAGVPLRWDSGGEVNRNCVSWWFIVRFLGLVELHQAAGKGMCTSAFITAVG